MEIILKADIEKLGYKDDLITVKDGYGRNFLIPKGLGVIATDSAKKMREETLKQRSHKEEKVRAEAENVATKVKEMSLKVGAKVGEKGKIFGSINSLQLADAIKKLGFEIDRKDISIKNEPIKEIGTYEAVIKFHREITETINFEVVGE